MTWLNIADRQNERSSHLRRALSALALAGALSATSAQAETGKAEAGTTPKGTVGLALLGAEAVMAVEAAFGVNKWWMYAVGGGAGAIGGGIGGYFIDRGGNGEVSMSLLVGGMVLAVPTTIAVLSATSFKPPKNPDIDDSAWRMEERYHLAATHVTPSLVGVTHTGKIKMEMPAIEVGPVFSQQMQQMYSLPRATAVRVPVFHLTF